jgi:hypothetical protein
MDETLTGVAWDRDIQLGNVPPGDAILVVAWPLDAKLLTPFNDQGDESGAGATVDYDGGATRVRRANPLTGLGAEMLGRYTRLSDSSRIMLKGVAIVILACTTVLLYRTGRFSTRSGSRKRVAP